VLIAHPLPRSQYSKDNAMSDIPVPPPPDCVRWGRQTELALANFPISGERVPGALIRALARIKAEAAIVNRQCGALSPTMAAAIHRAAEEIAMGAMVDQFPVDVFQTGSGTSTNMNLNEVIAHRATELGGETVHPNDHVNASQSSNDAFPSAIRIAACSAITTGLIPALESIGATLRALSDRHEDTVKMARTHLMDAVPMTFGQEVSGWARGVQLGIERLDTVLPRLGELPLGGTAVGTGLNAPPGFGALIVERLVLSTGLALTPAVNRFEAQSAQDAIVETSGVLKTIALTLHKLAGDIRLLGSGPQGGLGEIHLKELQAGSSIMPGKVNPVIAEVVQQVAAQVVGNDTTITFAATMSTLQLNTAMPVMARSILSSIVLMTAAATQLDRACLRDIDVDVDQMLRYARGSPAVATALIPTIGYDAAVNVVHAAETEHRTVPSATAATEFTDDDLLSMTRPHLAAPRADGSKQV